MDEATSVTPASAVSREHLARYEPPRFEVIPLDCEITAYAPDSEPLF